MCKNNREELSSKIINKLDEEGKLTFGTSWNAKINKENLINALATITKSSPLWKNLGYTQNNNMNTALRKIVSEDLLKEKGSKHWDTFFISLLGYKYCSKCDNYHTFDHFTKDKTNSLGLKSMCISCDSILHQNNILTTFKHMKSVFLREDYPIQCSTCGYDYNWSALDLHHIIDMVKPIWAINSTPSTYIFKCSPKTAEERFFVEKDNLQFLCKNCHQKHHFDPSSVLQEGLKTSLDILGFKYICAVDGCVENNFLHLHHNNPMEKEYSFSDFKSQTNRRILNDGFLENEMAKDVTILCANHHAEIHYPHKLI